MTIPFRSIPGGQGEPSQQTPTEGDVATPEAQEQPKGVTIDEIRELITPIAKRLEGVERRFAPEEPQDQPEPDPTDDDFYRQPAKTTEEIARRQAERVFQKQGGAAAQAAMQTMVDLKIRDMASQDEEFGAVSDEFRKYISKVDPNVLASKYKDPFDPENELSGLEQMWYSFRGRPQYRQLLQERMPEPEPQMSRRPRVPFTEPTSGRAPRMGGKPVLSEDQRRMARGLGISEEDLLEEMKKG